MASHHPRLTPLHIPQPGAGQIPPALYTAGLPSAIGPNFPMATPLNTTFGNQIPQRHPMHRAHPSLVFNNPAAFAATMAAQAGMPITPGAIPPAGMLGPQGFQRNRRQQSISLGGPPKAPLGGPNRKHSPMPVAVVVASAAAQEKPKTKKVVVKLPLESVPRTGQEGEGESEIKYSLWSRIPVKDADLPKIKDIPLPDMTTMEQHPIEQRGPFPATIDVYLPGKAAWDEYYQRLVDERLERLGVENGGNSAPVNQSHLHGRAASISSPADPALLMFKLNKLQQSQNGSLSVSPQPPSTSTSPNPQVPPRFQSNIGPGLRHGYSFSLANYNPSQVFQPSGIFNPAVNPEGFIPDPIVTQRISPVPGIDNYAGQGLPEQLHAPQGVAPVSFNIRSETATASSGPSRVASTIPDFNRGFGLDIPEENEEELQEFGQLEPLQSDIKRETMVEDDDATTAGAHTRHASKASLAVSLGGRDVELREPIEEHAPPELENPVEWNLTGTYSSPPQPRLDVQADPIAEWTATESLEEFSNPSDEERALHARHERRLARSLQRPSADMETPRRLPEFPSPPSLDRAVYHQPRTEDDIVSNPSDEEQGYVQNEWLQPGHYQMQQEYAQYEPVVDGQTRSPRPLPPLPHSRTASGSFSHPSMQHSRQPSKFNEADIPNIGRRESLNPFAKPFVFGGAPSTLAITFTNPRPFDSPAGHSRELSNSGRTLNVAAAEFKPGFTFIPPPGVPKISFPTPEPSRPLPHPPVGISPSRVQGREKRQRRDSQDSSSVIEEEEVLEEREGRDTIKTFQFPPPAMPVPRAQNPVPSDLLQETRPISPLPQRKAGLNAAAQPFTFVPSALSTVHTLRQGANDQPSSNQEDQDGELLEPTRMFDTGDIVSEPSMSPTVTRKRPPVLDFKHPTSTHTVPAALFRKAIVGSDLDGPTRSAVQSRLSSREIFEHMNSPSLDDLNVPTISRRGVRSDVQNPEPTQQTDPVSPSTQADGSFRSPERLSDYTRRQEEADQIEQRLEDMLDDRMELAKKDLAEAHNQATDAMVSEIISAMKVYVSEIADRLEEGTADARGEVDFELIRNILEHGVMDIRTGLRRDLEEVLRSVEAAHSQRERTASGLPAEFHHIMEEFGNRTVSAVTNAVVKFANRIDQIDDFARSRAADDRESLMHELLNVLVPHLETLRQPTMDFDAITARLAEAVKPHISQLIDLTSDKKETAGLILQRLLPALSALSQTPAHVDTDAIVAHLRVELAQMVPAADPHVLKEAVADLVVERLDSRLAVREKANSSDRLYSFISERIDDLHAPVSDVRKAVEDLHTGQDTLLEQGAALNKLHQDMSAQLMSLPATVDNAVSAINAACKQLGEVKDVPTSNSEVPQILPELEAVGSTVRKLATNNEYLATQSAKLVSLHETLQASVASLPQVFTEAVNSLQETQESLLSRTRTPDQSNEIRSLLTANADLQVQIAKARGAHGQIRVEKDLMLERMNVAEAERDRLRKELEEMRTRSAAKETEVTASGLRIAELEDALSHALARLESSDITAKAKEDRIATLEKQNREYGLEQYQLKSQIQKLELQQEWANRDKETLDQRLVQLQKDRDELATQQSRWEELHRTSEQVERLTQLIAAADSAEIAELKAASNRARILEGEHTSLQKRFREQEAKIVNLERAAQSARQNFAQAQQRITEWEKRAKEMETEVEATRSRLEEADEAKLQLDSDLSLVKMHLEEKEAAEQASKEQEAKLRGDIATLEKQVADLKGELEASKQARTAASLNIAARAASPHPPQWSTNGLANGQSARPSSRASTIYGGKSPVTPTGNRKSQYSSRADSVTSSPPEDIWASIHAPRFPTRQYPSRGSVASPTPSTVSLAPTQGDDGWWS